MVCWKSTGERERRTGMSPRTQERLGGFGCAPPCVPIVPSGTDIPLPGATDDAELKRGGLWVLWWRSGPRVTRAYSAH